MAVENVLIQQARATMRGQELLSPEQQQANEILTQTYPIAADLLNSRGRVKRSWGNRFWQGITAAVPVLGQAIFVACELNARKSGYHTWEGLDERVWSTSINDGNPVKVELSSRFDSRGSIRVVVQGLPERLGISSKDAFLRGNYEYDLHMRRASLEEAQKWQQLITGLVTSV